MKKVVFLLMILSFEVNSFADDQKYVPPIGIPVPSFGINETYRMYDYEPNQNPALTYYDSASGGKYTHYIDSTDANSTDSSNAYGTKAKPRKTIPRGDGLPLAGSIVEIHNANVNAVSWGGNHIGGEGTVDMPIFYRGIGEPNLNSWLTIGFYDKSQYIIVEGFKAKGGGVNQAYNAWYPDFTTNHISVRNCDFKGTKTGGGFGIGSDNGSNPNKVNNVVFYNNKLHDNGVWDPNIAEGDNDIGGVTVTYKVSYVWILESEFYYQESSSTMIGPSVHDNSSPDVPHHIYIGGNISHHEKQGGPWVKTAKDVIISQNISYGMRHSSSSDGGGFGFQYDPERLWFLFNTSYDNKHGFLGGSSFDGGRGEIYYIGNLVYDCQDTGIMLHDWAEAGKSYKVMMNTIYNCPVGIGPGWYTGYGSIFNNIISNCPIALDMGLNGTYIGSEMDYNLLHTFDSIKWDKTYTSIAAFQAGTTQGDNCVEADPLFIDPSKHNFNLQETSPVKDLQTSEKVQAVYARFLQLYGIDLAADIDGIPRTAPVIVLPEPEETSSSDDSDADVNTDTGSTDTGTVITETPSVPAVDTGSSNTTGTTGPVSPPMISPLPMPLADTSTAETSSSNNVSTAEYSAISILYSASSSGLHVDGSKGAKVRTIKVGRIFERYDDIYCPPNKNTKSSATYE